MSMIKRKKIKLLISILGLTLFSTWFSELSVYAQNIESRRVIQFSGVIIDQETLEPLIGVHIFSPRYGKGSTTDYFGKYSFAIKEGDSLLVTTVGYEKKSIIVPSPEPNEDKYTMLIELVSSPTYLEEVEVTAFPSEQLFRDAILALNTGISYDQRNLNKTTAFINSMQLYKDIPRSSSENFNDALAIKQQELRNRYEPKVFSPVNPVAWVKLIRSLKKK